MAGPPVAVQTAKALQEAAQAGTQDIEIRTHLDLRNLPRLPNPEIGGPIANAPINASLLYVVDSMRSMRVRLSLPPAPLAFPGPLHAACMCRLGLLLWAYSVCGYCRQ